MIWRALEAAAPAIARLGKQRFDQTRVALLGTLRKDGSPRISPVEPCLTQGHLLFGAMSWSTGRSARPASLASGGGALVQQAGAHAEAPELRTDRRFATEALGVASRQRLPAGVVGEPQRPRRDGGKGG